MKRTLLPLLTAFALFSGGTPTAGTVSTILPAGILSPAAAHADQFMSPSITNISLVQPGAVLESRVPAGYTPVQDDDSKDVTSNPLFDVTTDAADLLAPLPELPIPMPEFSVADTFIFRNENGQAFTFSPEENYEIPVVQTPRVQQFIQFYSERYPSTFQKWLNRSNKYMSHVKDILIREGVPVDLVALAFTESGFNNHAVSHANAVGMWQFISSTGRLYGLDQNYWVDERRDFELATRAAARFLRNLYSSFGDWYLALAAYNAGPQKIKNGIKITGSRDYFTIAKNRYIKNETRDYVPKYLALLIIYKNYQKFGFNHPVEEPLQFDTVRFDSPVNLYVIANMLDIEYSTLKELNPALRRPVTPPGKAWDLRVPAGTKAILEQKVASVRPEDLIQFHIVEGRRGDRVADIAEKYNVDADLVKTVNGLGSERLTASRPLFVPIPDCFDEEVNRPLAKSLGDYPASYDKTERVVKRYKVKRGDTLSSIARKFNVSVKTLQKLNPKVKRSLKSGMTLTVSSSVKVVSSSGDADEVKSSKKSKKSAKADKKSKKSAKSKGTKYTVKNGDTVWSIAKKFGVSVNSIVSKNSIRNNSIKPGKVLVIKG